MVYLHNNRGFIIGRNSFYVDKFGELKYFNSLEERVSSGEITYNRVNYCFNGKLIACLVNVYYTDKLID